MVETPAITGAVLRSERLKAGIQLQDLADVLGLDQSTLSRMETRTQRAIDGEFADRYFSEVRRIARERAEAVGAFDDTSDLTEQAA